MNPKLRALRKVREARRRLRDHAAAAANAAEQRLRDAHQARERAEDDMQRLVDEAATRIAEKPRAAVLLLLDSERERIQGHIGEATGAVQTAQGHSEVARHALRQRERDLRSSDKLMDRMRAEQEAQLAKAEQRLADDLAATRSTRREP